VCPAQIIEKKLIKFIKSIAWSMHYMALMLIALAVAGCLVVEMSKRHEAELDRQRAVEMLEIERDRRYNDSLIN
jgi:hypothetical protein